MFRAAVIMLVRAYQMLLSPLTGPCCRFYPTCSAYCVEAVRRHGCALGLWLAAKRLLKCHPLHAGGVDPVPPALAGRGRSPRYRP